MLVGLKRANRLDTWCQVPRPEVQVLDRQVRDIGKIQQERWDFL